MHFYAQHRWFLLAAILLLGFAFSSPSSAISPEEQLTDPVLEERARGLSKQLRCLVCQNQSIDDSDAELAKDLRIEVRNLIVEGKSDDLILADLRLRYGDYILLNPPVSQATYLLWWSPVFIVLLGVGLFLIYRRSAAAPVHIPQREIEEHQDSASSAPSSMTAVITAGLAILILIVATGLYSQFGRPDLPAQPLAKRTDEIAAARLRNAEEETQIKAELQAAEQAAAENPDDVDSWLNLAMRAAQAQQIDTEIAALNQAIILTDGHDSIKSMLAEALMRQADGLVTLPVRQLISEVLDVNPEEPRALYLAGLAAFQDEDYQLAIGKWQQLRSISAADAPWLALVTENIAQAAQAGGFPAPAMPQRKTASSAPMLDNAQIAQMQDMTSQEQADMILSMVDGLEQRLTENPEDLQGWQRLIAAREQLGDMDGVMRALRGAADADKDNPLAHLAILEFVLAQGKSRVYLAQAEEALTILQQLRPDGLEVLFFTGHLAQLSGDLQKAITQWQQLADQLEPDSPLHQQLTTQINALQQETGNSE